MFWNKENVFMNTDFTKVNALIVWHKNIKWHIMRYRSRIYKEFVPTTKPTCIGFRTGRNVY